MIYILLIIFIILNFSGIFIVGAKRTAFGTHGGKLTNTHFVDIATTATKAALTSANIKPELVDSVAFGNVLAVCLRHEL